MKYKSYHIEIRNAQFYAFHGVMQQEQIVGGHYTIDLSLKIAHLPENDEIEETVSYADIYEILKREMAIPSKLLESVCKRIIESILAEQELVEEVEITLTKVTPPMGGDSLSASVTIKGTR